MKNLSLILNAVLIIAVAILFYQVHSLQKGAGPESAIAAETTASQPIPAVSNGPSNLADAKIAYVNTDTINEHYQYIADFTKSLRGRKASLEAQMAGMEERFQKEYQEYQESAQAGIMPQAEMMKKEESLKKQQSDLANKQVQMQNLAMELEEKNTELQNNVKNFLRKYNNGKFDYILSYSDMVPTILLTNAKLDITHDVLKGLNDEYNASKGKK